MELSMRRARRGSLIRLEETARFKRVSRA